jgi:hypothetical protein
MTKLSPTTLTHNGNPLPLSINPAEEKFLAAPHSKFSISDRARWNDCPGATKTDLYAQMKLDGSTTTQAMRDIGKHPSLAAPYGGKLRENLIQSKFAAKQLLRLHARREAVQRYDAIIEREMAAGSPQDYIDVFRELRAEAQGRLQETVHEFRFDVEHEL